jgi:hypothetical protein
MYYSPTAGHVPAAANLASGELAINTADGILYYKNANSVVSVLANSGVDSHLRWDSANNTLIVLSTGSLEIPAGNTVQQPANSAVGMLRFNTDLNQFQGYNGTIWGQIGGGASANGVVYENSQTLNQNYTMTTGNSGESVGPITITPGVIVTIPAGSRWVIL